MSRADRSTTTDHDEPHRIRRGADPVALVAGVLVLLASAYTLADGSSWLPAIDPRWLIAGGALLIGLIMLAVSVRSGRRR
jgi:hypothetical protein